MDYAALIEQALAGDDIASQLSELTDDELHEFETALSSKLDELVPEGSAPSDDALTQASSVADLVDAVRETAGVRIDKAMENAAKAAELRGKIHVVADEPEAPAEPEPETPAEPEVVAEVPEVAVEPEVVAEPEIVPLAAAAPRRSVAPLHRLREQAPPPQPSSPARTAPRIRAGTDLNTIAAGAALDGPQGIYDALLETYENRRDSQSAGRFRSGSMEWFDQYSPDRTLRADASVEQNSRIIDQAMGGLGYDDTGALTAAVGGFCAPFPIRYELTTYSNASRPIRDALIGFGATRGGLQFLTAPMLSDIVVSTAQGAGSAIGRVTATQDAASATKPIQDVSCGTLISEQVWAVTNRLNFSQFADRYNPERGRAYVSLAMTAWARAGERYLMDAMRTAGGSGTQSSKVKQVNGGTVDIGAARQYIRNIIVACEEFRYIHRMGDDVTLRAVVPDWLTAHFAIDLYNQAPGDNTIGMAIEGRSWAERVLATENIRPIWGIDDYSANNVNGAGAPAWSTAQTSGALVDLPGRVSTLIYPEGSFMFLDGGQLDFGLEIKDTTTIAANRYQSFFESFEGVAFTGPEAYEVTTLLCSNGTTGSPSTSVKCGGVGS